jgi:hypothetical protein
MDLSSTATSGRVPRGRARAAPSRIYAPIDRVRRGRSAAHPLKISSDDSAELLINLAINGPSPPSASAAA